jgi:hypothetical protein
MEWVVNLTFIWHLLLCARDLINILARQEKITAIITLENIMRYCIIFSGPSDLAPSLCAPLIYIIYYFLHVSILNTTCTIVSPGHYHTQFHDH